MGSDVGTTRASDVDAIVGAGMWQVHLGRSAGKRMSRAQLEAAVANNEIGLETLVREPGAFSWTTAGAATGRSVAPTTPPEPERELSSANAIPLSTDDSDVDLASGDLPEAEARAALPSEAPMVKDVSREDEDPALTKEEAQATRPQPLSKVLAILAGLAFLGGVVIVAAPSRGQDATTNAKPTTAATTSAVAPQPTPVVKPPGEGPIVVIVVPPETGPAPAPAKNVTASAAPAAVPSAKAQAPKRPTPAKTASKTPTPAQKKGATASLPSVKTAPKPQSKAVAVTAHAQPARKNAQPVTPPKRAPIATPKVAPTQAAPTKQSAATKPKPPPR